MGKIFKALEKAEKQHTPKAPERSEINPRPVRQPVSESKIVDEPESIDRPYDSTPNSEPVQRSAESLVAPNASATVQPLMEPEVKDQNKPRIERNIDQEIALPKVVGRQSSIAKTEPIKEPFEKTAKRNGKVTIAPIKSVSENVVPSSAALVTPTQMVVEDTTQHDLSPTPSTTSKKDVTVKYVRTKVQVNDPQNLKNNNVLSFFDDFETTNQFKILRTQVLRKLKAIGGNSILVTSANPCEGKTFTSINLGVSIAKEFDRTVLIIDADIRRPNRIHTDFSTEFFSLKVEKGLTDYLMGDADIEDILINPGIDKLTLIPGGTPVDNSAELLNSARMSEMVNEIKNRYPSDRLVIIDGPALLPYPDALILSRYVDGVLPVVESEKTTTENLKKMMKHLEEVNILGVVLNKNKEDVPKGWSA